MRQGWVAAACVTPASTRAERDAAAEMIENLAVRQRRSAIDRRTTRHPSYASRQRDCKHIDKIFGWLKQIGGQRRTRFRRTERKSRSHLGSRHLGSTPHRRGTPGLPFG